MLKLRRGTVTSTDPLSVRVGDRERRAWADEAIVGPVREGDDVILNVDAADLELGSGGCDLVHANLSRGLDQERADGPHVMKLNYTSLQHPIDPVEVRSGEVNGDGPPKVDRSIPVLVLSLHGQLAPAAWAAARSGHGPRVGFVQTAGGALPGALSEDVADLRRTGLLCGHVTAAPAYGGELEAMTVPGALQAAAGPLEWDAAIAGPGPGIIGSGTALGHGGLAALDTAHAAIALGMETLLAPRMSGGDPRERHRGLSHHTKTVLSLLLRDVRVPAPAEEADELREVCGDRHRVDVRDVPLGEYAESGLPTTTMGRELHQDRLFFAAALAAGDALGGAATPSQPPDEES
jgi:hypothetical protein